MTDLNTIHSFQANSHILKLLGDELIGSDNLAIFELVKNSYDADATEVKIEFHSVGTEDQCITITDNGNGMSYDIIKNVWLEIGTDSKRGTKREVSEVFKRQPLGEKGVGRLAVHKLATQITLETKTESCRDLNVVEIDWPELIGKAKYIQDTKIKIDKKEIGDLNQNFKGTRIVLNNLRNTEWSRADIRNLARTISTLKSPFQFESRKVFHEGIEDKFDISLDFVGDPERQAWVSDIVDVKNILAKSLYQFSFKIDESASFSWDYSFSPPLAFKMSQTLDSSNDSTLLIEGKDLILEKEHLEGIGPISGKFYIFSLAPQIISTFDEKKQFKDYLKRNAGIKLYRDGIRVYNYGEPGNDWLELDLKRVNNPGSTLSNNLIIGNINLKLEHSHGYLKEKTNREGFDETEHYFRLKKICTGIVDHIANKAQPDRERVKAYIEGIKPVKNVGFAESVTELKEAVKKKKLDKDLGCYIEKVEKDYYQMRDVMVHSGMAGMNLSLFFHEIERELHQISDSIVRHKDTNYIKERITSLVNLLDGISPLLKQNKVKSSYINDFIEKILDLQDNRFIHHEVVVSNPIKTGECEDFHIKGPLNLLLSAITNIIDNSIYWTSVQKKIVGDFQPAIYIGTNTKDFGGPAVIIADNGKGFHLPEGDLTTPFRTTRPGGMGLGLYFASLVMDLFQGKIIFLDPKDFDIPEAFTGAVIALVFSPEK